MKLANIVFLIKRGTDSEITEVLMAMKKRGFGEGKWNGVGGKVKVDEETVEEAAIREAEEEIGVKIAPQNLKKAAEMHFSFEDKGDWETEAHAFIVEKWENDPVETEEMAPRWFPIREIPFDAMWSGDDIWIPQVLAGKALKGDFVFTKDDQIKVAKMEFVEGL